MSSCAWPLQEHTFGDPDDEVDYQHGMSAFVATYMDDPELRAVGAANLKRLREEAKEEEESDEVRLLRAPPPPRPRARALPCPSRPTCPARLPRRHCT